MTIPCVCTAMVVICEVYLYMLDFGNLCMVIVYTYANIFAHLLLRIRAGHS